METKIQPTDAAVKSAFAVLKQLPYVFTREQLMALKNTGPHTALGILMRWKYMGLITKLEREEDDKAFYTVSVYRRGEFLLYCMQG